MHFSTGSYTHLPQSKAPASRTTPHWAYGVLCHLARPRRPLATPTSKAGCLPPPHCALRISEEGTLIGTGNPSPWILLAFSSAPTSAPVSFLPIFEKPLGRGDSAHWCSFLTSHSVLNPQPSDLTSCSPFPVTISVVSRKMLMKSGIIFRNLFFWYMSVSVFAKMLPGSKLLVLPPHFSQSPASFSSGADYDTSLRTYESPDILEDFPHCQNFLPKHFLIWQSLASAQKPSWHSIPSGSLPSPFFLLFKSTPP